MENFSDLPENILLDVFNLLNPLDVLACELACKNWRAAGLNNYLWKRLFLKYFGIKFEHPLRNHAHPWKSEFLRIYYETPIIKLVEPYLIDKKSTISILKHKDQVLHVSFSTNGKMFATCSKDGYIKVWDMSAFPYINLKYSFDLKFYNWKYTQYSCFNHDNSLLLVSGVHFGAHSTSGEIGVFNLLDGQFTLQCRVINRPYDIFGTWYNEDYLISGNLHWFGHLLSCSSLWINKAWQETESENETVVMQTFKFFNVNGSSIRNILICDCLDVNTSTYESSENPCHSTTIVNDDCVLGLTPPDSNDSSSSSSSTSTLEPSITQNASLSSLTGNNINNETSHTTSNNGSSNSSHFNSRQNPFLQQLPPNKQNRNALKIDDTSDKYLVFTTGSKTFAPHQIGIKRIKPILVPPVSAFQNLRNVQSRLTERNPGRFVDVVVDDDYVVEDDFLPGSVFATDNIGQEFTTGDDIPLDYEEGLGEEPNNNNSLTNQIFRGARLLPNEELFQNYPEHIDFDSVDHLIELNGHVIGMAFSPDQRYLYVNVRSWPEGCVISNPLNPPPIAKEIEIRVIDMCTLKLLEDKIYSSHKAYTPNEDCFFLFLDVCNDYIASGAEDKRAYIWDRGYDNLCVAKLPHGDIVNCVAFNPVNPQILVSTTDDHLIQVWVSRKLYRDISKTIETQISPLNSP